MIVDRDTHPDQKIYYLGSVVISILSNTSDTYINYFDLYEKTSSKINITMQKFSLTMDWLYLLGLVKSEKNGIIKCF